MNGQQRCDRFHFDHDVVHEQIEAELAVELRALVDNWGTTFSRNGQLARRQLVTQTLEVNRLQKAWSEFAVDFDGGRDDLACEMVSR